VGPDVRLEGFVETSPFASALHRIEVFGGSGCHSGAALGGMQYGQGQEFLGSYEAVPGLADLDFSIDVLFPGGVEGTSISHVTLTATQVDRGSTSEFSRCLPIDAAGDVASADVPADGNGLVLDDRGVTVSVGSGAAALRRSAGAATGSAGKLFVTRYERAPDENVFVDEVATGFSGTDVTPGAVAPRYWYIADRGLTAAGGATSGTRSFDVCLDPNNVVQLDDMPTVVVVQRNETTGSVWVPHDTTQAPHGDTDYLCASGLTELGAFAFGTPALCGDLNDSGTITASEALLILKSSVGGEQCAGKLCTCDVNASGTISASDALAALKSAITQTAFASCSS